MLAALLAVLLVLVAVWAVTLVGVARSVPSHAAYWSQPRGEADGLLHVALGDSAAQGIGASAPDNGYVGLLADRLREQSGRPVQVLNLSRRGARIDDVLQRQLPALEALGGRPDLLTVAVGERRPRLRPGDLPPGRRHSSPPLPAGAYVADAPYFMHGR